MRNRQLISVSSLRPGDAFTWLDMPGVFRVVDATPSEQQLLVNLHLRDSMERQILDVRPASEQITVGYTNRRAKRQRGKHTRRLRFADAVGVAS